MFKQLCLLLLFTQFGYAFQAGDELSQNSQTDIEENIEKNLETIESGKHSPQLYATLGYDYFQTKDLANAVLYYEKAIKLDASNPNYKEALSQIKNELPVKITTIPSFFLWQAYERALLAFSSTTWAILQIVLFIVLLLFIYRWLLVKPLPGKYFNWIILGTLILSLCVTSIFAFNKKEREEGGDAAISMDYQEIYKAADERSEVVVSIGPGNKLFILDSIGNWKKVQLADRDIGWILNEKIKEI